MVTLNRCRHTTSLHSHGIRHRKCMYLKFARVELHDFLEESLAVLRPHAHTRVAHLHHKVAGGTGERRRRLVLCKYEGVIYGMGRADRVRICRANSDAPSALITRIHRAVCHAVKVV